MSLKVVVKSATNFLQFINDHFAIVVTYQGISKTVESVCNSPNPVWNQTLEFPLSAKTPHPVVSDVLKIVLCHYKKLTMFCRKLDSLDLSLREAVTNGQHFVEAYFEQINVWICLEVYVCKIPVSDVVAELEGIPGFHNVTKHQAQELIRPYQQIDGYFLLRPTNDKEAFVTLSVTHRSNVVNYRLKKTTAGQFHISERRHFPSIQHLLHYYQGRPIRAITSEQMRLLYPIPSTHEEDISSLSLCEVTSSLSYAPRSLWRCLGVELGVPLADIDAIAETHGDPFVAILQRWIEVSQSPSWYDLLKALRAPSIGRPDIAREIEAKYIRQENASVQSHLAETPNGCQQRYLRKLDELIRDTKNTIDLHYLKLYFIGMSGLGKTTFCKRLTKRLPNLMALPPAERKRSPSTHLAECTQVLAVSSGSKLDLEVSTDMTKEAQLMFAYLYSFGSAESSIGSTHSEDSSLDGGLDYPDGPRLQPNTEPERSTTQSTVKPTSNTVLLKINRILDELRTIVGSGDYAEKLLGKVLLNLIDMGGQPGFLEMLPFLSKGPGVYLAFFPLDKDLDEYYEVRYERGDQRITPYTAKYTIRETLSQILSAICYHVTLASDLDPEIAKKVGHFSTLQPVVSLVGTYQDKVEMQAQVEVVQGKLLAGNFSNLPKPVIAEAIEFVLKLHQDRESEASRDILLISKKVSQQLASDSFLSVVRERMRNNEEDSSLADEQKASMPCDTEEKEMQVKLEVLQERLSQRLVSLAEDDKLKAIQFSLKLQQADTNLSEFDFAVSQQLAADGFTEAVKTSLEEKLQSKNEALASITSNFDQLIVHPYTEQQFFPVDNLKGSDDDINPIREHLQEVFDKFFTEATVPIRPAQLLFGVILRKEYDIVTMKECIQIGKALKMDEAEVRFTVWYLHECIGVLIYYPEIKDKDSWFEKHVICSPNVVFDSISSLIVDALVRLHEPDDHKSRLTRGDLKYWTEKGQFTIAVLNRLLSEENKQKVKESHLIPLEKLIMLLEHVNLLAPISEKGSNRYFIPAVLECASKEEFCNPYPVDSNTPFPVKITFESGYVPVGIFCGTVSKLVSKGREGILGMKWSLLDSKVKRNFISFQVDIAKHTVELIAHSNCYEIRVIRQDSCITMYELCSYVLTTLLYVMSEVTQNVTFEPIIAFDCHCQQHNRDSGKEFCTLRGQPPCIRCKHGQVTLVPQQEHWFTKTVQLNEPTSLRALPYAAPDANLTFKWSRKGQEIDWTDSTSSTLRIERVTNDLCNGFYACEIYRNSQPFIKVYHCLKIQAAVDAPISGSNGLTLSAVREATWQVRAQWNDLGIELGIDEGTRKSIRETNYNDVDKCFTGLLEAWFKLSPSWSAIVNALRASAIGRSDIASDIMEKFVKI